MDNTGDNVNDYYLPDVLNSQDYYAFGAPMPGRAIVSSDPYRYTFNGKEKDPETVGTGGGTQDYGLRIYNPSLGKFLSVDPLTSKYPELTPYQFAANRPIDGIDLDGAEWQPTDDKGNNVATDADNISGYTWVGYDKFAYQNADGTTSTTPQGEGSKKIGVSAPAGTVATAYIYNGNSARKYSSDQFRMSGTVSIASLDQTNIDKINGLHPEFRGDVQKFILRADLDYGVKLRVTDGFRSNAESNNLYAQGRTQAQLNRVGLNNVVAQPTLSRVTNAYGGQSLHNYGVAIDVVGLTNGTANYNNTDYNVLGRLGTSLGLEWGGNWTGIQDRPHFQLPYTWQQLQNQPTNVNGFVTLPGN